MTVLLALVDVGAGVQFEEALQQAGLPVRWDAKLAGGPSGGASFDVVVLDADHLGTKLGAVADAWREHASVPGLVAIGSSAVARAQAPLARVQLVAPQVSTGQLADAIREAGKLRFASSMRWPVMRAAVGLPPAPDAPQTWGPAIVAARGVDLDIARAALRWHAQHYVTPTARMQELRDERVLAVPELDTASRIDGTLTVQSIVKRGPLDPQQAARLLWALASLGTVTFTAEVHDVATAPRRALSEIRAHLRARAVRLERSTFYDVLEISPLAEYPEIEAAYRAIGGRFAPTVLGAFDLAELAGGVRGMWDTVEKARGVLCDHASRGRYHDWLRTKMSELRSVWAVDPLEARTAVEAYGRGQRSFGDGDVHKAMGDLATACRYHPGHPDYESSLAWARYRVQVASGRDRVEAAIAERRTIEDMLLGCRPWPRALVALALLCAAAGDAESARWHLATALSVDPHVPAAAQLAQRLGMRR
nr:hypothetical protein [Kofleriaceae bacterium]